MEIETGSTSGPGPETSTGLPANISAALACLFGIIGGIIFFILEKKNAFVRFYAMQSIYFSGSMIALGIVSQICGFILGHIPVIGLIFLAVLGLAWVVIGIGSLVIYIITIVKAFSGVEWEIPIIGPMARKQLNS